MIARNFSGSLFTFNKKTNRMRRLAVSILLLTLTTIACNAQIFSAKTNVLMDALAVPNIDLSLTTGGRTAISASVFGSHKPYGKDAKFLGAGAEYRYWISGRSHTGVFFGLALTGLSYDITWGRHIYNGDAAILGPTFGYDIYLAKHVTLDLHGGCGAAYYRHHRYYVGDNYNYHNYNHHGTTVMPFNVGVSLVYIFN